MPIDDDFYRMLGVDNDPRFEMLRSWEIKEALRERRRRLNLYKWIALTAFCFGVILLAMAIRGM
jgi:hypothetical protein